MFGRDLRHVLRAMRRRPATSAVVIVTLTLALAANAATFSLVDAVLLKPLPFDDPDRLVALWDISPDREVWRVSSHNFRQWRDHNDGVFENLALYAGASAVLDAAGDPVRVSGTRATREFFPMLGVRPTLGRLFAPADFAGDGEPVVVVSHAMWSNQLGGDPAAIGRTIRLDGDGFTVIGVLPKQLLPLTAHSAGRIEFDRTAAHFWLPISEAPRHNGHTNGVLAKLFDGVSLDRASTFMLDVALRLESSFPDSNTGVRVRVVPLRDHAVGNVQRSLWILLAAAGLLLLIASANVSSVLLARTEDRAKELAVRSALGAGTASIARLVALEGIVFVAIGGVLGSLLGRVALDVLPTWTPVDIPRLDEAGLDARALVATFAFCALCAVACTLIPALRAGRRDPARSLHLGGRGNDRGVVSSPLHRLLVVAEVALAVVLIVASGLLLQSLVRLQSVDAGFSGRSALVVELQHPESRYAEMHRLTGFYDELRRQVGALPGVRRVAAAYDHPLTSNWSQSFRVTDAPEPPPGQTPVALFRTVTPGYFDTVGIPIVAGRDFTEADRADSAGAVIVNEALAKKHFSDRDPIGQQLTIRTTPWQWGDAIPSSFTVVGLVGDVRFWGLDSERTPAFYVSYRQTPQYRMHLLVDTPSDPLALLPAVRRIVRELDPALPISQVETLQGLLDQAVARPRFSARLLTVSAGTSLVLAVVGLWGLLGQVVRRRTHEIGVRLALGARPAAVFRLLLHHGLTPASFGAAIGVLAALGLSRFVQSILFETSATSPAVYAAAILVLFAAASVACALPALRAARVDPLIVLRRE